MVLVTRGLQIESEKFDFCSIFGLIFVIRRKKKLVKNKMSIFNNKSFLELFRLPFNMNPQHHMMMMYFSKQSFTINVPYLLFKQWNIGTNNITIYVSSTFLVFALGFINQLLLFLLHTRTNQRFYQIISYFLKPIAFLFSVTIGYLLMLIVMTYNFGLFMAILGGNVFGYILFHLILQELFLLKGKTQQQQDSSQPRVYHSNLASEDATFVSYQQPSHGAVSEDDENRTSGRNFFDFEYDDLENTNPNGDPFAHFTNFADDSYSSAGAINKW